MCILSTEDWLYHTVIIDLCALKVIGWSINSTLKTSDTVVPAWRMTVIKVQFNIGVEYITANPLVKQSMGRKVDCWDNAVAKSFFRTVETKWNYRNKCATKNKLRFLYLNMGEPDTILYEI